MTFKRNGQTIMQKLFSGSGWAIFTMFVWELVEEGLENLIALAISSALAVFITKALSTLAIITATQGVKVALKRFLLPVVREFTFKEGNDKMKGVKTFFAWLNANKCTVGGIALGALTAVSGAGLIDVNALPALVIGSLNITPIVYYLCLGIMTGVVSFFPESIDKFKARIAEKQAEKEEKAFDKIASKELATEEKLANQTQAQQDKAKAKEDAKKLAEEAKAKADAEYRTKVDAHKAKLIAEKANKQ